MHQNAFGGPGCAGDLGAPQDSVAVREGETVINRSQKEGNGGEKTGMEGKGREEPGRREEGKGMSPTISEAVVPRTNRKIENRTFSSHICHRNKEKCLIEATHKRSQTCFRHRL